MANYFKNCLKLRSQIYSHSYRKLLSTNVPETSKIQLSDKDYENFWQKSQPNLDDQKPKLNFDEFKIIIENLKNMIDEWSNTSVVLKNKPASLFMKNVFQNHDSVISKKFLENFTNWSVLYQNVPELALKGYNTSIIKSKANQNLTESIDYVLLDAINRLSSENEITEEDIRKLSANNLPLDKYKFSVDFGLSLYNYLKKANKITSQNEEIITTYLVKASLNYILTFSFVNSCSIKYIMKNSNKLDHHLVDCMSKTEANLEKIMKNYKNFDSISDLKKAEFFKFFCFFESKWLNAVKWLIQSNQNQLTLNHLYLFNLALNGSIRFERYDYFEKLFSILKELWVFSNIKYNNQYDLIFRDYMNTCVTVDKLEDKLDVLLKVWSDISYVPNKIGQDNFEFFIEKVNNELKDTWYDIIPVKVNVKGRVLNADDFLEKAEYKEEDLKKIAQLFKRQILSQDYLMKEKVEELKKIDDLIMRNDFDFIMDGMNIALLRYKSVSIENLKHAIRTINKTFRNKNFLIVTRDHLFDKNRSYIEKLMEKNHTENPAQNRIHFYRLDSIFEDDKFFLYAALISKNAMLITNDYLSNHSHFLNEYGIVFREWLLNKKLVFEAHLNRFLFAPEYKLKVNKIGTNKWIIPYLKDKNNYRKHGFFKLEKKYFKNKN